MIKELSVKNFKSHADTQIELGRVTALIGPNGCGKTSLLQAVLTLTRFVEQRFGSVNRRTIHSEPVNWDRIRCFTRKGQSLESFSISVTNQDDSLGIKLFGTNLTDLQGNQGISLELFKLFGPTVYFKAISRNISLPSYTFDIPPIIGDDGSNAASVISDLKTSQEEVYEQIENDLKEIVPLVKRIRVHRVPHRIKVERTISANGNTIHYDEDQQVNAQELIFDTQSGNRVPASMISEGTLVTLALLTLLHTTDANLFLLDDIEQGLHPLAQRQLIKTLKEFAQKHNKQILLTSHSGYIIDELDAKDVWVMTLDNEGISRCKRLSDHHDAERLLQVLTTGELADAVGEDWVLGTPQAAGADND